MILRRMIKALIILATYISCITCFILALIFRFQHWGQYTELELIKRNLHEYWFNLVLVFISYCVINKWKTNQLKKYGKDNEQIK